jgi:hypothetical protein
MDYARLVAHLGHQIEIANYADENVALECVDCSEVLIDYDKRIEVQNA